MRLYFVLSFLFVAISNGAKILSVLPSSSKSHFIYPNSLLLELAASGHQVTVMSPFPMENPPNNYRTYNISQNKSQFDETSKNHIQMNMLSKIKFLYSNTLIMTNITLQHPEMKKLLKSQESFDLIILDLFLTDAMVGLSTVFNCPIIALTANGPHSWVTDLLGSSRPSSFVPHLTSVFIDRSNLGKRLENEFFHFVEKILLKLYHFPQQEKLFNEIFPNSKKSFHEVRNAIAVTLVNPHFHAAFPKSFLPNTIEIAGMQINEAKLQPLPSDIKNFIENSEHGIIYFSLGGYIRSTDMNENMKKELVNALSSLKQKVIWKWDEAIEVDPTKIMIRPWLPQFEILAHEKTEIMITHGGIWSSTEAIYFAKKMIVIPIFGDQLQNAKKIANGNYGLVIDFSNFTGQTIKWAVDEMLSNPSYSKSMKEESERFRDKTLQALEIGKFWVEKILRHKQDLSQIQSAGLSNFIELHDLDVYIIIFLIIALMLAAPAYFLKRFISFFIEKWLSRKKINSYKVSN